MKAGIYLGKEQIELRELPIPEVGDEDSSGRKYLFQYLWYRCVSLAFMVRVQGIKLLWVENLDMRRYHALLRLEKMLRTLR